MKSFKEYLTESKKTYNFKIKIAGDCPEKCAEEIKKSLSEFDCSSVSDGKRTPITARLADFPNHKNVSINIFDVVTNYPATSKQVLDKVSEGLGISAANILALNEKEQQEVEINHTFDEVSGKSLLLTPFEKGSHQDLVGEKQKYTLLRDLNKTKHAPEQIKGVNDQLLAKSVPTAPKGK